MIKSGAVVDNASQKVAFTGVHPYDIESIYILDGGIKTLVDWLNFYFIAVDEENKLLQEKLDEENIPRM